MAIACACPGCATPFNVTDDMAGKRAKCPKCLMVFTLPAAATADPKATAVATDLFPQSDRNDPDRKPSRRSTRNEDEDDRDRDEPRSRRSKVRRKGGSALPWVLGIGAAVLVVLLLCGGTITVLVIVAASRNPNPPLQPVVNVNNPPAFNPPVGGPPVVGPGVKAGPGGQVRVPQGPGSKLQLANGVAQIGTQLTFQDPVDPKDNRFRCKIFVVELQAGRAYTIDMVSPNQQALDPYLRIEGVNGNVLAEDDDGGEGLNARIFFRPPRTESYVVIATCYQPNHSGPFTLTIRESGK